MGCLSQVGFVQRSLNRTQFHAAQELRQVGLAQQSLNHTQFHANNFKVGVAQWLAWDCLHAESDFPYLM
jgi:hypothetical protein